MNINNKGISLIESLVAVMLTSVAIIGLLTMQPLGLRSAGKADSLAHATEIMQRELESIECDIMRGTIPANKVNTAETLGKETFTVNTTIINQTDRFLVRVRVTGQGHTRPVTSSIIVTRQEVFD